MRSFHRDGKALIRFIGFSPVPLKGYFRFNDVLQIFSLPDDAPKPEQLIAFHPFVIEYSFKEIDVSEMKEAHLVGMHPSSDTPNDHMLQAEHHWSKQDEILSILSVITSVLITKEKPEHRWFLNANDKQLTGKFAQTGYYWDGFDKLGEWFSTPDLQGIGVVDANAYYNQYAQMGKHLDLSNVTNPFLETYFELDDDTKKVFLSACALFSKSLESWAISHSLTYIGIVSSLEALIEFDNQGKSASRCKKCGQPMYKVRKKFLDFMATYGSNDEGYKKFADQLYARRSGIGHQGKLLAGDVVGQVIPPYEEMTDSHELSKLSRAARICLVNWLLKRNSN